MRDLILSVWRRKLERERADVAARSAAGFSEQDQERHRELTLDLKALRSWESGSAIIAMELPEPPEA